MRKNIVISVAMNKGGTGKSSTTANLTYSLAKMGYRVLAIDTDPQTNLTRCFNLYPDPDIPAEKRKNFYNAFIKEDDIRNHIVPTEYENIDFVMGSVSLSSVDSSITQVHATLAPLLADEENGYDFIIIDQNPSFSSLNTSVLQASHEVLIPVEASMWGVEGLQLVIDYLETIMQYNEESGLHRINILGAFFNKVDKRENISRDARLLVKEMYPDYLLPVYIPTDTNIKNSQWEGLPLEIYNKRSTAVEHYHQLAKAVVKVVKKRYK